MSNGHWTFGQKVGAGFAVLVALTALGGGVSAYALRTVVAAKDEVITTNARIVLEAEQMTSASGRGVAAIRGFLLTGQNRYLEIAGTYRAEFLRLSSELRSKLSEPEGRRRLEEILSAESDHDKVVQKIAALKRAEVDLAALADNFETEVQPKRDELKRAIDGFSDYAQTVLQSRTSAASEIARSAERLIFLLLGLSFLVAGALAYFLARALSRQIGTAVGQVQSSSAELQAAANQQASGAREQASAMTEMSTTISELLTTSRQIAESARRVAEIADQTARAAQLGDNTVERSNEAIAGIRRQVDLIVNHMLELGRKSQQIGAVLDLVSELSEQTNILAINATIEAAGAGEAGRRFAVVADEIRKLADRVGGSTKEVRGLIEDVRSAVNATVMTTETGSKSVESGTRQFADVATSFRQINALVVTTTEAAREIELSTKQQASAVEQVNVAIGNVAQASKENQASTAQTLQTVSQLSALARDLQRLVQPEEYGGSRAGSRDGAR